MGISAKGPTTSSSRVARFVAKVRPEHLRGEPWHVGLEHAANPSTAADAATMSSIGRLKQQLDQRRATAFELYQLLGEAARRNGLYSFSDFADVKVLPSQGLYVIFDPNENSVFSEELPRIVRIGTHGVALGSKSVLRTRLRAHFGQRDGSGNHRASIFRLHTGNAIIARDGLHLIYPDWGLGMSADASIRLAEAPLERLVSHEIGQLRFTFLEIPDPASPKSMRAVLERSFINFITADGIPLEIPSSSWLGRYSPVEAIRSSGLWNIQHVGARYDPRSLSRIKRYVRSPRLAGI